MRFTIFKYFSWFFLFAQLAFSTELSTVSVSGDFLTKVSSISTNKELMSKELHKSNVLIVPGDGRGTMSVFLSGLHPIMSPDRKKKLAVDLSGKTSNSVSIRDFFDVVLNEEQASTVVKSILFYKDAYMCVMSLKSFVKQGLRVIKNNPNLIAKMKSISPQIERCFKNIDEVAGLCVALEKFCSSRNGSDFEALKKAYSAVSEYMDVKLEQLEKDTISSVNAYLTGVKEYCAKFKDIISTDSYSAVQSGVQALSELDFKIKLSYIIDQPGDKIEGSIGSSLFHLVQLSHTEPMYIFLKLTCAGEKPTGSFFFTNRDMCPNCRKMVSSFASKKRGFFVVLSKMACTGKSGEPTTVDFILGERGFATETGHTALPNVCQIRVPNPDKVVVSQTLKVNFLGDTTFIPRIETPSESPADSSMGVPEASEE